MQVTIIDVGPAETHVTKTGKDYQSVEVVYKGDNGQTASKKLMSFANPDVFKVAQTWQKGATINVDSQKDDNGYWQWKGILADGQAPAPVVNAVPRVGGATTRATGNSYPTSDERGKTQVYIIRQSSLGHAVATLNIKGTKDLTEDPAQAVISLAKQYEAFVLTGEAEQVKEDLPF
jgi:hypothetical protein